MKYLQYCEALSQPSVSTQITLTLPPERLRGSARTEAGATRDREDDVRALLDEVWLICLPLFWSVNELANVPPFWLFSSQPSTWTFLPFCLL